MLSTQRKRGRRTRERRSRKSGSSSKGSSRPRGGRPALSSARSGVCRNYLADQCVNERGERGLGRSRTFDELETSAAPRPTIRPDESREVVRQARGTSSRRSRSASARSEVEMTKAADRMNREDAGLKHEGMAPGRSGSWRSKARAPSAAPEGGGRARAGAGRGGGERWGSSGRGRPGSGRGRAGGGGLRPGSTPRSWSGTAGGAAATTSLESARRLGGRRRCAPRLASWGARPAASLSRR
jgi:hypothetical protein